MLSRQLFYVSNKIRFNISKLIVFKKWATAETEERVTAKLKKA